MLFAKKLAFAAAVSLAVFLACRASMAPAEKATHLADLVMRAQGGQKNWDATRCIEWDFFKVRKLVWDKKTGDVRIDFSKRDLKIILNLNSGAGRVWLDGAENFEPDTLKKYLDRGRKVWINDSYWLFMPFKLRDPGVNLRALGKEKTLDKRDADKLELTFNAVGVTPENKYHVWIDARTRLVSQWAFFKKASDEKPEFVNPWEDYRDYGKIKLSGSRGGEGEGGKLTPIRVFDAPPPGIFERF